jgi:hypothetical protein
MSPSYTYSAYKVLTRCIIVLHTDTMPASMQNIQRKLISYDTLDCTGKESLGRSGPRMPCHRDSLSGAAMGVEKHLAIQMMIYLHATC